MTARPRSSSIILHDIGGEALMVEKEAEVRTKKSAMQRFKSGAVHQWNVIRSHPRIGWSTLVVFMIVCGVGLGAVYAVRRSEIVKLEEQGLELAQETGDFFSTQLDQALFPLFSIAQFCTELDIFHDLNPLIGPDGTPGSAPYLDSVRRNVTGICDEPERTERYEKIAQTIKKNANMPGVLMTVQLVPYGVICMVYPLVNTEDFAPDSGIVMDSRPIIGLDLMRLKADKEFVKRAMQLRQGQEELQVQQQQQQKGQQEQQQQQQGQQNQVVIQGPIVLEECNQETIAGDCVAAVRQAFIARMAVRVPGARTEFDGIVYEDTWGVAAVLLNWDELVKRSGMIENFEAQGLGFQLTKTDAIVNSETKEETKQVVILAETSRFQTQIAEKRNVMRTVTVALDTTDNEWVMTVAYPIEQAWLSYMLALVVVFAFGVSLLVQTLFVQQRRYKTMEKKYLYDVAQPQKLRLRLFLQGETFQRTNTRPGSSTRMSSTEEESIMNTKPIADMYPKTTVMFADIAGFTAWSSERSPALIFSLLQNIFFAFDKLAEKHGVFKVDTFGDCYVAAAGFPEPQQDHAVRMAKLARDCLAKVPGIVQRLEQRLGPDTGDLRVRFGLHSGPVTAGVMAGVTKARLQLMGETIITAAKMEGLGKSNRIHISEATAQLLREGGKAKWIAPRADLVHAKGQGFSQTYWLMTRKDGTPKNTKHPTSPAGTVRKTRVELFDATLVMDGTETVGGERSAELWGNYDDADSISDEGDGIVNAKTVRLVEWLVEFLADLIKPIVAGRGSVKQKRRASLANRRASMTAIDTEATLNHDMTLLEEVEEVISLPRFNLQDLKNVGDIDKVVLSGYVVEQLRDFVSEIAMLYHGNPFHNFEHASHVTMACHALLNRIVTPEDINYQSKNASKIASDLHEFTFGIMSDPLTHFAMVLSALIHDVDHTGVPNAQLAQEDPALAERYQNQSIAEQNSVDIAWELFMEPKYADLHACIFSNQSELLRFRQIIVNSVLATDLFDDELKALRNLRWDKAFTPEIFPPALVQRTTSQSDATLSGRGSNNDNSTEGSKWNDTNRKATIVIEHIIQASDVAHTMQHWHVYTKWNDKLFQEIYIAWKSGRSPVDPSKDWYKGELCFFDNYVIPLAQKLAQCGVFGVSSDECLQNALQNRSEWESRGESVVEEMLEKCLKIHG